MKLKNTFYLLIAATLFITAFSGKIQAAPGDTTRVTAIEFGGERNVWLDFPSGDEDFRRILMNYKIKCPCGEWDYIAYVFVDQFFKVDTVWNGDDYTVEKTRVYYSDSTTVTERYEIMRYITPYGNGLNVGDGFTYTIDVTDFEPLLRDSVFLRAPNGQEDVEITFDFIQGTPPRDVVQIRKMWNDNNVNYNEKFET